MQESRTALQFPRTDRQQTRSLEQRNIIRRRPRSILQVSSRLSVLTFSTLQGRQETCAGAENLSFIQVVFQDLFDLTACVHEGIFAQQNGRDHQSRHDVLRFELQSQSQALEQKTEKQYKELKERKNEEELKNDEEELVDIRRLPIFCLISDSAR